MIETKLAALAALAACFASSALAADEAAATGPVDDLCRATADCDYETRDRLLSIPVWIFEGVRAQRILVAGQVRFEKRGHRLIAHIDYGIKCEVEVRLMTGGFICPDCEDFPKTYVRVDDAYQNIVGTYIYTLRPPR